MDNSGIGKKLLASIVVGVFALLLVSGISSSSIHHDANASKHRHSETPQNSGARSRPGMVFH